MPRDMVMTWPGGVVPTAVVVFVLARGFAVQTADAHDAAFITTTCRNLSRHCPGYSIHAFKTPSRAGRMVSRGARPDVGDSRLCNDNERKTTMKKNGGDVWRRGTIIANPNWSVRGNNNYGDHLANSRELPSRDVVKGRAAIETRTHRSLVAVPFVSIGGETFCWKPRGTNRRTPAGGEEKFDDDDDDDDDDDRAQFVPSVLPFWEEGEEEGTAVSTL
uniref:Uncharacterized protein n=1 Tax=Anopheles farauti TaxID=69004 RepID=A0A182QW81_9DIPT